MDLVQSENIWRLPEWPTTKHYQRTRPSLGRVLSLEYDLSQLSRRRDDRGKKRAIRIPKEILHKRDGENRGDEDCRQ